MFARCRVLLLGIVVAACASRDAHVTDGSMVIRASDERERAVDRNVTVIGVQTRTKQPTVNGVDVDGDWALAGRKVIAKGVLRRHVVRQHMEPEALLVASRGPGTYFSVIDPETGQLAKTKPYWD
jgi:hypothetical protein